MRWLRDGHKTNPPERVRISSALVSLCSERGYRQTSISDVVCRAGLEPGDFDRHFTDLEDCFCVVYQELSAEFLLRAGSTFSAHERWRDQIRAIAHEMFAFLQEDTDRAYFLFLEVLGAGDRALLIRDQYMQALFAFIDLGRQELDDPDSLSPDLAAAIGGGIYNLTRMEIARNREDPASWARFIPQLMYAVVEPYLGTDVALEELDIPVPVPQACRPDPERPLRPL